MAGCARSENANCVAAAETPEGATVSEATRQAGENSQIATPAWVVTSPEVARRAEAGDADAMFEIANGYMELAASSQIEADDQERLAMRKEAMKWIRRRAKAMADREGDLESVRKRAEAGDAAAQRNLGFRYSQGIDVEKDEKLAFKWTKKAAEGGDAKAQFNLAGDYAGGRSVVAQNPKAATEWYRKALPGFREMAERGEPVDCKPLVFAGQLLLEGGDERDRVERDSELGMGYLRLAADLGDAEAKAIIEKMDGMDAYLQEQKEAFRLIDSVEDAAKAGDMDAKRRKARIDAWKEKGNAIHANVKDNDEMTIKRMLFYWTTMPAVEAGYEPWYFEAGKEFAIGEIVPKDMEEASKWFRLAADLGDARAEYYLGLGYLLGIGVPQDDFKALDLLRQSGNQDFGQARETLDSLAGRYRKEAEEGDSSAQFILGAAYEHGDGVSKDPVKAVKWYRKAAEQGHPGAQAFLGWCLLEGDGVKKDEKVAVEWLRKAAEQGNSEAQLNYGRCLFYGNGVEKDQAFAAAWYRKAAEQGELSAIYNLGLCYLQGTGTVPDEKTAIAWFEKAAKRGHSGSIKILEQLKEK
ncbi:MAG: sel1 repeat family protein [Kiritimatiellae bacterium]|nr:sel1 repeat family protein [Kiritimatiellia bacterium]